MVDAPYESVRRAYNALQEEEGAWEAFKRTIPQSPTRRVPDPEIQEHESPLGPRLERRANRFGDAVPYGQHGAWGKYREGVKEMTMKIDAGKVTAEEASELLKQEDVFVSSLVLSRKARKAPRPHRRIRRVSKTGTRNPNCRRRGGDSNRTENERMARVHRVYRRRR